MIVAFVYLRFLCTNPYHLRTVESHCSSFDAAELEVMKWTLIMFDYNLVLLPAGNTKVNARLMFLQTPLEGKTSDGRPGWTQHKLRIFFPSLITKYLYDCSSHP